MLSQLKREGETLLSSDSVCVVSLSALNRRARVDGAILMNERHGLVSSLNNNLGLARSRPARVGRESRLGYSGMVGTRLGQVAT